MNDEQRRITRCELPMIALRGRAKPHSAAAECDPRRGEIRLRAQGAVRA